MLFGLHTTLIIRTHLLSECLLKNIFIYHASDFYLFVNPIHLGKTDAGKQSYWLIIYDFFNTPGIDKNAMDYF